MAEEGIFSVEETFTSLASGVLYNRGPAALEIRVVYRNNDHEERDLQAFHVMRWDPEDTKGNPAKTMVVTPPGGTSYYFSGTPFIHGIPPSEPILAQILGQEVTLNVGIVSSTVTVDIDIVAQTVGDLNVNLAASAITLNINISSQSANLNVDIVAQTIGNVSIDIAAQTIGNVAVNIAASITLNTSIVAASVTLDIDIVAQTVGNLNINLAASAITLNVNLSSSSITLNISVVAQTINLNIDFAEQTITLRPEQIFQTFAGNDIDITGVLSGQDPGVYKTVISYTLVAGKTLYIYEWDANVETNAGDVGDCGVSIRLRNSTQAVILGLNGGINGAANSLTKPIVTASGVGNDIIILDVRFALTAGNTRQLRAHFGAVEL